MLKFVNLNQENPKKSDSEKRLKDFNEIYAKFSKEKAENQSSRYIVPSKIIYQIGYN